MLELPFNLIANRFSDSCGGASRDIGRTWDTLLDRLMGLLMKSPAPDERTNLDLTNRLVRMPDSTLLQ
jgi:hypothetical protein